MIRVLIADDHDRVRQRMVAFLRDVPDISVVGEARDGQAAVDFAQQLQPDVILMDIRMPHLNGLQATGQLRTMGHHARVLLVSITDGPANGRAAARCGANGFLFKGGSRAELIAAIRWVYGRQSYYYSPAPAPFLAERPNPGL